MSVQDICELSSILQGDDNERMQFERKEILLNSAIAHQEQRVMKCILINDI